MERIEAQLRVVTPLFAGGAEPANTAEVRASAIKGMLRFWWRALAWSRHGGYLEAIRGEEADRFGSTEGASPFRLYVDDTGLPSPMSVGKVHTELKERPAARYLGYGLMQPFFNKKKNIEAGTLWRPCFGPDGTFTIQLVSPAGIPGDVLDALKVWGLLGGLGSRTRRGYGSLALEEIRKEGETLWSAPRTVDDYLDILRELLKPAMDAKTEPEYSAFSHLTRLDMLMTGKDALDTLDEVGTKMVRYRSWGKDQKLPGGEQAEQNFLDDHEWFFGKPPKPGFHPRRAVFGLPHNYFSPNAKPKSKEVKGADHDRRASPLFIHVHKLGDDNYIAMALILRSRFLPKDEKIQAGGEPVEANPDWQVLEQFLEGLEGHRNNKGTTPYFPERRSILP